MLSFMTQANDSSSSSLDSALHDLLVQRPFAGLPLSKQLEWFCHAVNEVSVAHRTTIWTLSADLRYLKRVAVDSCASGTMPMALKVEAPVLAALKKKEITTSPKENNCLDALETLVVQLGEGETQTLTLCPLAQSGDIYGAMLLEYEPGIDSELQSKRTAEEARFAEAVAGLISLTMAQAQFVETDSTVADYKKRLSLFTQMAVDRLWETDEDLNVTSVISGPTTVAPEGAHLIGRQPWQVPTRQPMNGDWVPVIAAMENREVIKDLTLIDHNADGSKSYREANGEPQFDEAGKFTGYIGVTRDITERIAREAELNAIDQRYRNASKLARLGHWIWDREADCCSYCSPEMAEIFGVSVDEYLKRTGTFGDDQSWYHPDDRERYRDLVEMACETGTGWTITVRIVRDDGSIRHLKQWAEPGLDDTGRVVSTLGVLLDITDQVELREDLKDSRAKLANLVDNLPGALFRIRLDDNWSAVYRSKGYYRQFVDPSRQTDDWDKFGSESLFQIDDSDKQYLRQVIGDAVRQNIPYEVEYGVTTVDGDQRWVWERGRPVEADNGDIELEGIMIDATEKHLAEQALVKSQRGEAIGQLTGGVAHDFNNLLAVILGNLELVRDEIADPNLLKMLDASINATTRGADLTRNMLAFARKAELEPAELNLNDLILNTQNWIMRTLPSHIEVNTHLADDLWTIRADPSSTESALLNLIINARDAMHDGGKLTIETANLMIDAETIQSKFEDIEPGEYVMMAVSDTGHGIAKEKLKQVFEPFFTTKAPGDGSGLGLSMIDGFIRQSGGTVRVYSEERVGTTFKLFFNAMVSKETTAPAQIVRTASLHSKTGGRILVAEDETGVLAILVSVLRKAGYEVVPATSGDAALQVFEKDQNFDLLVTDVVMPGNLLGPGLVRALRDICPDLPAIFLTGYAAEATVHGNGLRPEDIRLMKPIRRAELLETIAQVMQAPAQVPPS